jgi:hypothetical protein
MSAFYVYITDTVFSNIIDGKVNQNAGKMVREVICRKYTDTYVSAHESRMRTDSRSP